jgi:TIR domain
VAEIFVSYTSKDRDWAFWIGQQLEGLGYTARLFDWEVSAGGNVVKWMVDRHDAANHVLCVVSPSYLDKTKLYSEWERLGAQLAAINGRGNFVLPVLVQTCEVPTLLATAKRCDLYDLGEAEARAELANYLKPAAKPSSPVLFQVRRKATIAMLSRRLRRRFPSPAPRARSLISLSMSRCISWGATMTFSPSRQP